MDLVSGGVDALIQRLASYAYTEIKLAWGVEDDLDELAKILDQIRAILSDAEQKQREDQAVKKWMENLQHFCYDAEDVLDEFEAEIQRQRFTDRSTLKRKVRYRSLCIQRLIFRFRMAHRVMNLRERMDSIDKQKGRLHLSVKTDDKTIVQKKETHSFVLPTNIVGRREERLRLLELLLGSTDLGRLAVVPIVGIGGLGKTTLARMAYGDEKVVNHFEIKVWISMPVDFDQKQIVKDIIKCVSPDTKCDSLNMEHLQTQLRFLLKNKRCLFVFDDVWNVTRNQWLELRTLLDGVSQGSRVIVTSRDKRVASIMTPSMDPEFNLPPLLEKEAVQLFLKHAFDDSSEEKKHPDLVEIGKQIVRKCGGNPLAVKSMGSLLYSADYRKWITVRDSEIWKIEDQGNEILPSLRISYDLMPSYLKQCFAYCAIFPKNYEFNDLELIHLWIANGLIQSGGTHEDPEEIGQNYWVELWSRSFFEEVQEDLLYVKFRMHDLIHELSLSVAQSESSVVKPGSRDVYDRKRHLSFTDPNMLTGDWIKNIDKLTGLRTIMFPIKKEGPAGEAFLSSCLTKFKHLRVLYLHDSSFEELPNSIGDLKNLRFLHFCGNKRLKRLPKSICNLQNLQSLGLARCDEFEELPKDMKKMINLRFLDITTKQKNIPDGRIGLLKSLRTLFIGDCPNLESLNRDLRLLASLKKLFIGGCPKLTTLPPGMMNLGALEELLICNCESLVLEMMEPSNQGGSNSKLRSLTFSRLPKMVNFPKWIESSTKSLQSITIEDCPNFRSLPHWLPRCSSLRKLIIEDCPRVSPLRERLPELRELRIENCGELSSSCEKDGADWLKIAHIPEIYIEGSRIK